MQDASLYSTKRLGAVLAAAIVNVIQENQSRVEADKLRLMLAEIPEQTANLNYREELERRASVVLRDNQRVGQIGFFEKPLTDDAAQERAGQSASDALLVIDVDYAFVSNSKMFAGNPYTRHYSGFSFQYLLNMRLITRKGKKIANDRYVINFPIYQNEDEERRVVWWASDARYRAALDYSIDAVIFVLLNDFLGAPRYQHLEELEKMFAEDKGRLVDPKSLDGKVIFQCDNFQNIPRDSLRFGVYRSKIGVPVSVHIECPVRYAKMGSDQLLKPTSTSEWERSSGFKAAGSSSILRSEVAKQSRPEDPVAFPANQTSPPENAKSWPSETSRGGPVQQVIPTVGQKASAAFSDWMKKPAPKAFALSGSGHWAAAWGNHSADAEMPRDPSERALLACGRQAKIQCRLYAVDDHVVWDDARVTERQGAR